MRRAGRLGNSRAGCPISPVGILVETIPHFHDTVRRMADFRRAVRENQAGRRDEAEDEIAFILDRENEAGTIVELLASGDIPYRVTHNDTKINNILFDAATDKALCVIDLDTVMPGTSVYDFGDAVPFGCLDGERGRGGFIQKSILISECLNGSPRVS